MGHTWWSRENRHNVQYSSNKSVLVFHLTKVHVYFLLVVIFLLLFWLLLFFLSFFLSFFFSLFQLYAEKTCMSLLNLAKLMWRATDSAPHIKNMYRVANTFVIALIKWLASCLPDIVVCVFAPPRSSCVTSSFVTDWNTEIVTGCETQRLSHAGWNRDCYSLADTWSVTGWNKETVTETKRLSLSETRRFSLTKTEIITV